MMLTAAALRLGLGAGPGDDPGRSGVAELPASLSHDLPSEPDPSPPREEGTEFSLGPAGGFLQARGADHGTWFAGAQARLHFLKYLAAEGSITFHENRYQGGDAR